MFDLWARYFKRNTACIFRIQWLRRLPPCKLIRYRIGNAAGFYLLWFHVTWRMPYSSAWAFDARSDSWVPGYMLTTQQETGNVG